MKRGDTSRPSSFERRATKLAHALAALAARVAAAPVVVRGWVRRHLPSEAQHLFGLTLLVGVVCGLTAVAFHLAIRAAEELLIERALTAPGSSWIMWTILSPTLGGLFAGACLTWIVPGARGSGVPQVKAAYATENGRIRARDAVGKFVIGTIQIGSGASLGREGPTAQICAGAANLLARITSLPPRQMRRLTPVGVAAGIAAAFNAPIAAVTFTIEEIVGALDNTVLSGVVVAAALAAVIERGVLGVHPVIQVDQAYGLAHASSLVTYALMGVAAAVVSVVFTDSLLGLRLWFRRLRVIPLWTQPAIGGLVTGCLAVLALQLFQLTGVNGGGYATLGRALAGDLGFRALLALCVLKLIATVFSYSSGGAGGIFAPSLFIGAMLGGAFGYGDVLILEHERAQLGAFALVGMGAVFAGVVRAPITSVLIIFEMTGSYGLVLPLMLANMTSYALARAWRSVPIYEALFAQDGIELPHATARLHPLERLTVTNVMTTAVRCLRAEQTVGEAAQSLEGETFSSAPMLDERGAVIGVVALSELRRAASNAPDVPVQSLATPAQSIGADEALLEAMVRMTDQRVRQLCVVTSGREPVLIGIVSMSDIVHAHARSAPKADSRRSSQTNIAVEVRAAEIARDAVIIDGATKLTELDSLPSDARCFIVRLAEGYGAILPEDLNAFFRDGNLRMLTAADVARAAPLVSPRATLEELTRVLHNAKSNALTVCDAYFQSPVGIVSRSDLADALLDWYALAIAVSSTNGASQIQSTRPADSATDRFVPRKT
jgi:CIC family chloride channel protein